MSIVYLAADLGPAEVALEKQAKAFRRLKTYDGDRYSIMAEFAAHDCRMLSRKLEQLKQFSASVDRSGVAGETREAGLDAKHESAVPAQQGDAQ